VDGKFHINANSVSFDFLIPTTVEFKGVKPKKVEYPKPTRFTAEFASDGLDVYEGSVAVVARFPKVAKRKQFDSGRRHHASLHQPNLSAALDAADFGRSRREMNLTRCYL